MGTHSSPDFGCSILDRAGEFLHAAARVRRAAVLYLTVLKRSRTRTVGYRALDCEVVAADGGAPSFRAMLTRLILWPLIGPGLNLFSISQHDSRQTISDMIAGTIVIRAGSEPIRTARRIWSMYFFMRRTFLVSQAEQ